MSEKPKSNESRPTCGLAVAPCYALFPMTTEEYKSRFIARLTSKGVMPEVATNEHDAWVEAYPDVMEHRPEPEMDADEAISYWEA